MTTPRLSRRAERRIAAEAAMRSAVAAPRQFQVFRIDSVPWRALPTSAVPTAASGGCIDSIRGYVVGRHPGGWSDATSLYDESRVTPATHDMVLMRDQDGARRWWAMPHGWEEPIVSAMQAATAAREAMRTTPIPASLAGWTREIHVLEDSLAQAWGDEARIRAINQVAVTALTRAIKASKMEDAIAISRDVPGAAHKFANATRDAILATFTGQKTVTCHGEWQASGLHGGDYAEWQEDTDAWTKHQAKANDTHARILRALGVG